MSSLGSHRSTVRLLRALLAVALVAFVALVGLYLFGRQGRPTGALPAATTEPTEDEDFSMRSEGFELALTRGDEVIFEIRGREQRSDRTGRVRLEEVHISMRRDEGEYRVTADQALYNQDLQQAKLEGGVVISGKGLTIVSDHVDLEAGGQRIFARDGVRLETATGLEGRADSLRADLDKEIVTLLDNVVVRNGERARVPFRLETRELFIQENGPSAHARGGVLIESPRARLAAQRLNLFLHPETREVSLLRVMWEVEGEIVPRASGAPLSVAATALSLLFDPESGEPERLEVRGLARRPARLQQTRPRGGRLALSLTQLAGHFDGGVLVRADLSGPVEMVERREGGGDGGERRARAERGEARFAEAQLAGLTLIGGVSLTDGELRAEGQRAYLDLAKDALELLGEPVRLVHPLGRLEAPRVMVRGETGLLHALDGVSSDLSGGEEGPAQALPGGDSEGPVRVESDEAFWESETRTAIFRGAVRAWQGANTLFAEQLRTEPEAGRMSASGEVRSIWKPAPDATNARDEADAGEGRSLASEPMEITSEEVSYDRAQERIVYTGSVHAEQAWTSMRCQSLSVLLDESGQARHMECEGEVRIVDSRNQRVLEGDLALYDPETSLVEVFGDPLTVVDADGTKVEGGRHFTYDLESGDLRLTASLPGNASA